MARHPPLFTSFRSLFVRHFVHYSCYCSLSLFSLHVRTSYASSSHLRLLLLLLLLGALPSVSVPPCSPHGSTPSVDPQPGSLPLRGQAPPLSEGRAPERHQPPPAALGRQKGDARTMFGSSIAGWHEGRTFVRKCVVIMDYRAAAPLFHLGLASVSPLRIFGTVVVVEDDDDDEETPRTSQFHRTSPRRRRIARRLRP